MQVMHILREKGRDVASLASDATLFEATRVLSQRRIGALVIRDGEGRLAGILSERDVVRALSTESVTALARPVSVFMTRAVATCTEADTVEELMEMMTQGRFRHVPVVCDGGQICGVVSIGDVVRSHIEETTREAGHLREYIAAAG